MRPLPILILLVAVLSLFGAVAAHAEMAATAGAYRLGVWTEPSVVPLGRAEVWVRVADASGKPVEGARLRVLAKMAEMDMGERELSAAPVEGQPSLYHALASFAMEGRYDVRISLEGPEGPEGPAIATIPLRTGEETAPNVGSGRDLWAYLPWVVGLFLALFVVYRLRRAGQVPQWRSLLRPEVLLGLALVVLAVAASGWAVKTYRRPNSMALVDALASAMSNMLAPPGQGPVALATVEQAPVEASIRYTGSAVGYVEQEVYPPGSGRSL